MDAANITAILYAGSNRSFDFCPLHKKTDKVIRLLGLL